MPGIFVRSVGPLDWDEEGKEPVLTVPGSYWLCHKKNIYKFTLKFHKSIRNTKEFNYSKDLMRVIRRILKCNPPQGQQFSTKNLFVEYNHTIWTRPDKMFAMLKFRDKPDAVVYHQAFILTIKIVDLLPADKILSNDRRLSDNNKTGPERRSERGKSDAEIKAIIKIKTCSTNKSSNTVSLKNKNTDIKSTELNESVTIKTEDIEDNLLNKELNFSENSVDNNVELNQSFSTDGSLSNRLTPSPSPSLQITQDNCIDSSKNENEKYLETEIDATKRENEDIESKDLQCSTNTEIFAKHDNEDYDVDVDGDNEDDVSIKLRLSTDSEDEMDVDEDVNGCGDNTTNVNTETTEQMSTNEIIKTDINIENDLIDKNIKLSNSEDVHVDIDDSKGKTDCELEQSVEEPMEVDSDEPSKQTEDTHIETTSLPYQYIIERDIENSRIKCIQKNREFNDNSSSQSDITRDSGTTTETPEDQVEMQCLDMTDLVMKGLMFTLRQEEDSVKIVKQTTKVEVDEVLENSEKVETKEGDPCLLNSSLLKLESMITNIDNRSKTGSDLNKLYESLSTLTTIKKDESLLTDTDENTTNEISRMSNFKSDQESSSNLTNNVIISPTNIMKSNEPEEENDIEDMVDVEEEDIIPEAFQRNLMQVEKPEEYEGLLMDDFEEIVTWKTVIKNNEDHFVETKNKENKRSDRKTTVNGKLDVGIKKTKSNRPKVISDEIIKNNDLPHSLLSMLINNKSTTRKLSNSVIVNGQSNVCIKKSEPELSLRKEESSDPIIIIDSNVKSEHDSVDHEMIDTGVVTSRSTVVCNVNEIQEHPCENKIDYVPQVCEEQLLSKSLTSIENNDNIVKEENIEETVIKSCDKIMDENTNFDESIKSKHSSSTTLQKRYPTRVIKESNQPVYVFKQKQNRKSKSSGNNKKLDFHKLIEDLSLGPRVLVERLDLKTLRS